MVFEVVAFEDRREDRVQGLFPTARLKQLQFILLVLGHFFSVLFIGILIEYLVDAAIPKILNFYLDPQGHLIALTLIRPFFMLKHGQILFVPAIATFDLQLVVFAKLPEIDFDIGPYLHEDGDSGALSDAFGVGGGLLHLGDFLFEL